jgi:Ca-activated chloride channel family protein
MDHTYADVEEGVRHDVEVEFVTRRAVDVGDARVHRLVVADRTGAQFAVLVAPDRDVLSDLKTGETYRIEGLLGADPVPPAGDRDCPDCGGDLRPGVAVDAADPAVARAAVRLDLTDRFGVVDGVSAVGEPSADGLVDGWRPMDGVDRPGPPARVCTDCGRGVEADELDGPVRGRSEAPVDAGTTPETVGFRERVANGLTPRPGDVRDARLFADHRLGSGSADRDGVAPRHAAAASDHPLTGETERYLSVDLHAARETVERPRLDLVVALDVSGSMDGRLGGTTKLAAAKRAFRALTRRLHPADRLGVVLFDHRAHVARSLRGVESTDLAALRRHVDDLGTGGGTDLGGGVGAAVDRLADAGSDPAVERRAVVVTGETVGPDLVERAADAAARGVHVTTVGLGVSDRVDGVAALSGVRGATHRTADTAAAAERLLGETFDYLVAPLAFDLTVDVDATGVEVTAVHGVPAAEAATGRLVDVGTLFPAPPDETYCDYVLVGLTRTVGDPAVDLTSSWTERDGTTRTVRGTAAVPTTPEAFGDDAVRTAVALARYARELRDWARTVHDDAADDVPLTVTDERAARFDRLRTYLAREAEAVGDDGLRREVDVLDRLCEAAGRG